MVICILQNKLKYCLQRNCKLLLNYDIKLLINTNGFEAKCSESIYAWYSHIGHLVQMLQGCMQKDNM